MKTQKMSLANIEGKLSRAEMKNIMAGSGSSCDVYCGSGSYYTCSGTCGSCQSAGNGSNPYVAGGDKLCLN